MSVPYSRYLLGSITWYSALIVAGIVAAFFLGSREEKRLALPPDTMMDATLVAVPCGIVGARLYYVAMEWSHFAPNPISIVYIWEGGLAIYGGVLGGIVGLWFFCRKKKISLAQVLDIVAPGLVLAQAIGRWGNYFNMEAFGPIITDTAWMYFPFGVQIPDGAGLTWHMATFFYESMWSLGSFALLMSIRKEQRQPGNVFLWYLLAYGSGRYLIEPLRMDSLWLGPFRVSQLLSLLLCLGAALFLLWRASTKKPRLLALAAALLAVGRWFAPKPWAYGFLLLLLMVCFALFFLPQRVGLGLPLTWRRAWVMAPLAADWALLLLAATNAFVYATALQAVITSLTLPCYVLWLQKCLHAPSR